MARREFSGSILGFVVLSAVLLGCPPKYPKCEKDEHCAAKEQVCVEGLCQQCRTNDQCGEGLACKGGRCEMVAECKKDVDCKDPMVCRAGRCEAECKADSDCSASMKCSQDRCIDRRACKADEDCGADQHCSKGLCELDAAPRPDLASRSLLEECKVSVVHFDYNDSALRPEDRDNLARVAECMKQKGATITIEGHCDERGTTEYNLALGDRRAQSVFQYMSTLGVPRSRLRTISKGEEEPLVDGHDEAAWSKNRRVEFKE